MLVACNSQSSSAASAPTDKATDNAAQAKFPATPVAKPVDVDPQAQARSADAAAAAEVVRRYYAAIEARDYETAYAQWSDHGKSSHQSLEKFQQGFADTRTTSVKLEPCAGGACDIEGAAGSLYVSIPVRVHAELNDGASQDFSGSYVLRRVNNVDGSSEEERRWHIASAALHPAK